MHQPNNKHYVLCCYKCEGLRCETREDVKFCEDLSKIVSDFHWEEEEILTNVLCITLAVRLVHLSKGRDIVYIL